MTAANFSDDLADVLRAGQAALGILAKAGWREPIESHVYASHGEDGVEQHFGATWVVASKPSRVTAHLHVHLPAAEVDLLVHLDPDDENDELVLRRDVCDLEDIEGIAAVATRWKPIIDGEDTVRLLRGLEHFER